MAERTLVTRQVGLDALTRRFMQVQDPYLRQVEPGLAAAQASKALTLGALLGLQRGTGIDTLNLGEVPASTNGSLSADRINPITATTASIEIHDDTSQGGFSALSWASSTTYKTKAEAINDLGSVDEKKHKNYQLAHGDQHAGVAIDTSVVFGAAVGAHDPSDEIHLEVDFAPASSLAPGVYTATLVYKENQIEIWSQQLTAHVIVQQVTLVPTSTPELVLKHGGLVDVPVTVINTGTHPVVFHFYLAQGPFGIALDTTALAVPAGTTKQESITFSAVIEQNHSYQLGPQQVELGYDADGASGPPMFLGIGMKPGSINVTPGGPTTFGGPMDPPQKQGDVFFLILNVILNGFNAGVDFSITDLPPKVQFDGISKDKGKTILPQTNRLDLVTDSNELVYLVFSIAVDAPVVNDAKMTMLWNEVDATPYGVVPLHLTFEYLQKNVPGPSGKLEGNDKVSAETEFLMFRSDGTWAWKVKLHSDSTWSSDNYVVGFQFTFADGGGVKFGTETMNISPGNDDTYTFGGLSDGPTAQLFKAHWVDLATNKATGLSITGHSAGQPLWKIVKGWVADGYQWTKDHPTETAAAVALLGGKPA